MNEPKKLTEAGTDIDEVKRQNANSGLSYNEIMAIIAHTNGKGTAQYSDTDPEEVKRQIHRDNK
ncbi:gamma-type small acid-soluble spore protein [Sporosarcina thermotolerans]|uniref:Gamma-type small acid-soluble spore protein n=1 Tax=Sporosarcina thermotolerans TaxID=633404 RepID=A0AAW9AAR6_9BACL|nr:gamma-type small acid-soluble spore protein [Sporosarcina thermotolerans]MDW0116691.1 gamma-type small acid-soluble spore protein [Sporosarcina thermotolerans]WHT48885.1 gamma-type small acid-soluble spore protein [Sporosarcina thermotolerans]